jgi:formylglycine-generating enzyme required for sulfatase activity
MEFCLIPKGEFLFGDNKEKCNIDYDFWISKYPITNSQFQQFVDADGYTREDFAEFWKEAAELGYWKAGKGYKGFWDGDFRAAPEKYTRDFSLPNHPVVGVSWHEALAFSRWMNANQTPTIFTFRLPKETEWEKAAYGLDGREYPWGDEPNPENANTRETQIGMTSAVGCFPKTPEQTFDCEDMCGNVWEWTLSKAHSEQIDDANALDTRGDEARVFRGGSWHSSNNRARRSFRNSFDPNYRDYFNGFRVVRLPSP